MKKSVLTSILSLVAFCSLGLGSAVAEGISFEVGTDVVLHHGEQQEYVYTLNPDGEEVKLSQLNWEEKNIPLGVITFDLCADSFNLKVEGLAGLPGCYGSTYDYDWFNVIEYANSKKGHVSVENTRNPEIASIITNYSRHNNHIKAYLGAGTKFSYSIEADDGIQFSPYIKGDFTYTSFSAQGGEKSYGVFNSTGKYFYSYDDENAAHLEQATYEDDDVILELFRRYYNLWIGTDLNFAVGERFSGSMGFGILAFSYVNSIDHHARSNTYYKDQCLGYICGFTSSLSGKIRTAEHQALNLRASCSGSQTITGKTSYSSSGKKGNYIEFQNDWAGSGFWSWEASVGYSFCF